MRTKLKIFRIMQKLTQQQMSEKLGYAHAYYGHVERGLQKGSANFWAQLQHEFDLTDDQLQELKQID